MTLRALEIVVILFTATRIDAQLARVDREAMKISAIAYYSDSKGGGELLDLRNIFTDTELISRFREIAEQRRTSVCRVMITRPHYLVLRDQTGKPIGGYLINWGCSCPVDAGKANACLRPILISEKDGKVFWSNPPSFHAVGFGYTPFPEFQAIFRVSPDIEF